MLKDTVAFIKDGVQGGRPRENILCTSNYSPQVNNKNLYLHKKGHTPN
jgi:hypothetical protein